MIRAVLMQQRDIAASYDAVTLEQALTMATHSGPSLGRPGQLGRIAIGHIADLVLVGIRSLHYLETDHPIPALDLHARAADVTAAIVNGRVVVEGCRLTGIDEDAIAADAREALKIAAAHH